MTSDGRGWNTELVDDMFSPDDVRDIKQIAIGGPHMDDYIAWNYTKNDIFYVSSAYHLRMTMNQIKSGRPESSSSVHK